MKFIVVKCRRCCPTESVWQRGHMNLSLSEPINANSLAVCFLLQQCKKHRRSSVNKHVSFTDAPLTYPRVAALSCLSSVTLSLFYPSISTLLPILPIFSEITRVIHQHAAETRLQSYCLPQSLTVIHHHTEIETVCLHTQLLVTLLSHQRGYTVD